MNKVWIYSITYYKIDSEYRRDLCGTYTEVFSTKKSADKFKRKWEEPEHLKSLSNKRFQDVDLSEWDSEFDSYKSKVVEKVILD